MAEGEAGPGCAPPSREAGGAAGEPSWASCALGRSLVARAAQGGRGAGDEPGSCGEAPSAPRGGAEPGNGAGPGPGAAQRSRAAPILAQRPGAAAMAWYRLLSWAGRDPDLLDTPLPQSGAYSTAGATRTAQAIQSTAERLEVHLQALKGSSDPLTLEFLQALEAPMKVASRLLAENHRLRREVEELKSRLAAPPPQDQANPPPAPWASSPSTTQGQALLLQVRVCGKTAGCERQFLQEVSQRLTPQGFFLQAEQYEPHSTHPLLLFCPIASRSGTDISNALAGIPTRKTILVVLHHQPNERATLYANSKRQVCHLGLLDTVDGCFSTHSGFYPCPANTAAVTSVAAVLQQLAQGNQ